MEFVIKTIQYNFLDARPRTDYFGVTTLQNVVVQSHRYFFYQQLFKNIQKSSIFLSDASKPARKLDSRNEVIPRRRTDHHRWHASAPH
jgi:hypothetical protein